MFYWQSPPHTVFNDLRNEFMRQEKPYGLHVQNANSSTVSIVSKTYGIAIKLDFWKRSCFSPIKTSTYLWDRCSGLCLTTQYIYQKKFTLLICSTDLPLLLEIHSDSVSRSVFCQQTFPKKNEERLKQKLELLQIQACLCTTAGKNGCCLHNRQVR